MIDSPSYEHCPKCLHTPLPGDQALPAACPACGLILAKFAAATRERLAEDEAETRLEEAPRNVLFAYVRSAATYVPDRVGSTQFWGRAGLLLLFSVWGVRLIWMNHRTGELGNSFLHGPLLVFHEAGHVIFSFFGEFIMILGGTLAQLLMPTIMAGAFLFRNRDPFGAAIATWLFGVSLLDVAPYVYDALHPRLVLLGGHTGAEGGHDWIYLLGETGLLRYAHGLGWLTHKLGALVVLLSIAWAGWILARQRLRIGEKGIADCG